MKFSNYIIIKIIQLFLNRVLYSCLYIKNYYFLLLSLVSRGFKDEIIPKLHFGEINIGHTQIKPILKLLDRGIRFNNIIVDIFDYTPISIMEKVMNEEEINYDDMKRLWFYGYPNELMKFNEFDIDNQLSIKYIKYLDRSTWGNIVLNEDSQKYSISSWITFMKEYRPEKLLDLKILEHYCLGKCTDSSFRNIYETTIDLKKIENLHICIDCSNDLTNHLENGTGIFKDIGILKKFTLYDMDSGNNYKLGIPSFLRTNSKIVKIDLSYKEINVSQIVDLLNNNESLEKLKLECILTNDINNNYMIEITNRNSNLKKLTLDLNIYNRPIPFKFIKGLNKLRKLIYNGSKSLDPEFIRSLSTFLPSLEYINYKISQENVDDFCIFLESPNTKLTKLDISSLPFQSIKLAESIGKCETIKSITINSYDVFHLSKVRNHSLESITFTYDPKYKYEIEGILKFLENQLQLKSIIINGSYQTPNSFKYLIDIFESHLELEKFTFNVGGITCTDSNKKTFKEIILNSNRKYKTPEIYVKGLYESYNKIWKLYFGYIKTI